MAGICEHVQYKPKLWLEKMEMFINGEEGGGWVEIGQIRKTHDSEQRNTNSLSHIILILSWPNVVKFSVLCLGLPGNLFAVFLCLQDKNYIFFKYSWEDWKCSRGAQLTAVHALYNAGLPYNGYICMSVIRFDLHTVMQSQPVPELHRHSLRQTTNVAAGEFSSRLVHLYSIMKQSLNGETGCLQVGLCVRGVFKINRRSWQEGETFFHLVDVSGFAGLSSLLITWSVCCVCLSYPH